MNVFPQPAIPQLELRWPLVASAALHALLFMLLILRISTPEAKIPVGVDLLYSPASLGGAFPSVPRRPKAVVRRVSEPREKGDLPQVLNKDEAASNSSAASTVSAGPVGVRDGAIVSALERYKFELRLFLESRKIYPEMAKRLRQTGKVVVSFRVAESGDLTDVSLEQSSASELIDRAALDLVKNAPRFKPLPSESNVRELKLSLPLEYIL